MKRQYTGRMKVPMTAMRMRRMEQLYREDRDAKAVAMKIAGRHDDGSTCGCVLLTGDNPNRPLMPPLYSGKPWRCACCVNERCGTYGPCNITQENRFKE